MKKIILCALALCVGIGTFAQAQLQTRKYRISDFHEKTLQVVLTGNTLLDAAIKTECHNLWHISPWEVCSQKQFEERKGSADYYFMAVVDAAFKQDVEPGIKMLSVYKGGEGKTGVGDMFKVISIPLCSAGASDGDEMMALPALLTILQDEIEAYIKGPRRPSQIVRAKKHSASQWDGRVCIDEGDLAFEVNNSMKAIYKEDKIDIVEQGVSAKNISTNKVNSLAGYLVAPDAPGHGNVCYVMVVDCFRSELLYIARHSLSKGQAAGFTRQDIEIFCSRMGTNK